MIYTCGRCGRRYTRDFEECPNCGGYIYIADEGTSKKANRTHRVDEKSRKRDGGKGAKSSNAIILCTILIALVVIAVFLGFLALPNIKEVQADIAEQKQIEQVEKQKDAFQEKVQEFKDNYDVTFTSDEVESAIDQVNFNLRRWENCTALGLQYNEEKCAEDIFYYLNYGNGKVPSDKKAVGPYSLAHVNSVHKEMTDMWPKDWQNLPATKYLDLNMMLFWWLEKNKDISINEKVERLWGYVKDSEKLTLTYDQLVRRELQLDTKGLIPTRV